MIVVVLGRSRNHLKIKVPFEQIIRVDCTRNQKNVTATLLHLASPAQFNRHVLPTYLPEKYKEKL